MPNRILKETICTSETIDALSWFEEVTFYRLIANCDDYGRADARVPILKAKLFPLKTVTDKQIGEAISKLSTVGIVAVYEYDGRPYLQLVTWDKHQSVRNKKSKFPAVNGSMELSASENMQLITGENTCMQLKSIDIKCSRNPIQSNTNPIQYESNPILFRWTSRPNGFEVFWKAYPRHTAREKSSQSLGQSRPLIIAGNLRSY